MTAARSTLLKLADSGAGIAVAMAVMNVATYGYTMVAARSLGPGEYGALAAMMNLLLVISVGSLGLQATAARRISAHPDDVHGIEAGVRRLVWRVALTLGAVLLVAAPLINHLLRLDQLGLAALAALAAVPLTLTGGYAGILQGERRWLLLSFLYLASGLPRLVVGTALFLLSPSALTGFAAVTLGTFAPALVGLWALRQHHSARPESAAAATGSRHSARALLAETVQNSQALLAFFALSNVDVIVARNALSGHDAGLYAGGLIMTKVLMFLPQFVVVVAFPSMAASNRRTRALTISLLCTAVVGALCTAVVAVASPLALAFVGGSEFEEVRPLLWSFALLGTVLALIQLVVYSVLARRGQRSALLVWAALAALVVGGLNAGTVVELLLWVVVVDAALLLALVAISYVLVSRHPEPESDEPADQVPTAAGPGAADLR